MRKQKELSEKSWLNVIQLSRHQFANDPLAFFRELTGIESLVMKRLESMAHEK